MAQHPSPAEILQKIPPIPQQIWCDEAEKNTALMDQIFGIMTEIEAALPEVQAADEAYSAFYYAKTSEVFPSEAEYKRISSLSEEAQAKELAKYSERQNRKEQEFARFSQRHQEEKDRLGIELYAMDEEKMARAERLFIILIEKGNKKIDDVEALYSQYKNAEGNLNAAGLKAQEEIKIEFCRSASADVLEHLRFKREKLEAYLATHRRLAEIQAMENYLLDEAQLAAHYPPVVALTEYEILKSFLVDYLSSFDYLPGSISNK